MDESFFNSLIAKNILKVENNRLQILDSINISSYGARAWTFTLQSIGEKKGEKYLFNLGYLMGEDSAKEISDLISKQKKYLPASLMQLENILPMLGFGFVKIEQGKKIRVVVEHNSIINFGKDKYGSKSMICEFYRGAYSAFVNVFLNKKISLKNNKCICKNDSKCIFEE